MRQALLAPSSSQHLVKILGNRWNLLSAGKPAPLANPAETMPRGRSDRPIIPVAEDCAMNKEYQASEEQKHYPI